MRSRRPPNTAEISVDRARRVRNCSNPPILAEQIPGYQGEAGLPETDEGLTTTDQKRNPQRARREKDLSTKGHEERRRATKGLEEAQEDLPRVGKGKRFPPRGRKDQEEPPDKQDFSQSARSRSNRAWPRPQPAARLLPPWERAGSGVPPASCPGQRFRPRQRLGRSGSAPGIS